MIIELFFFSLLYYCVLQTYIFEDVPFVLFFDRVDHAIIIIYIMRTYRYTIYQCMDEKKKCKKKTCKYQIVVGTTDGNEIKIKKSDIREPKLV